MLVKIIVSKLKLRFIEKKEFDFCDIESDCENWHHDGYGEIVCEVEENAGGPCWPWECPLCNFVRDMEFNGVDIELVEKIKEVV